MVLLIIFALLAGAGTALSPCVLPVLPAVLSAGLTGGRRRPLGVVAGLALSFTFATVALVYVIAALGLPNDLVRNLAIGTLLAFGLLLLVPPLADRVEAWYRRYHRDGLEVVGVHTPEFPFEKEASNVRHAIGEDGLTYPVVQDNDYGTWTAYGNQYWPAKYLIDAQGRIRYVHFGEGEYAATERAIRKLLAEAGHSRLGSEARAHTQTADPNETTPESYLGAARAERFVNGTIRPGPHDFGSPPTRPRTAPPRR